MFGPFTLAVFSLTRAAFYFSASGGKGVNILASPTTDLGKLLACLHGLKASGAGSLTTSIKTAQLALKHRKNRNGAQRLVVFVGSPVEEEERDLARLGAVLKKSSVSYSSCVEAFLNCTPASPSRLPSMLLQWARTRATRVVFVPSLRLWTPAATRDSLSSRQASCRQRSWLAMRSFSATTQGTVALRQVARLQEVRACVLCACFMCLVCHVTLLTSSCNGDPSGGGGGGFAEYGGVDPAADPELAMAMRVSMEEARAAARDPAAAATPAAAAGSAEATSAAAMDLSEEELLLQQVRWRRGSVQQGVRSVLELASPSPRRPWQ